MGLPSENQHISKITNRFKIEKKIGSGGMGEVFLAQDLQTSQFVALKTLQSKLIKTKIELFKKEAEILSKLSHPNLVRIYDFFDEKDSQEGAFSGPFFSMEYIQGPSLQDLQKHLSPKQSISFLVQFCRALHYLHSRCIFHRDIKPSNAILQNSENIKILDFGLAEIFSKNNSTTALGTLSYMPPEAFWGEYNEQSDLFSLGVLFYELLSGQLPFEKPLSTIPKKAPPSLRSIANQFPQYLTDLIERLIQLNPSQRPSSALSVIKYINQHAEEAFKLVEEENSKQIFQKIPWIGRQKELESVWKNLKKNSATNKSSWITITGPTGVGRSRFLEEIKWELQLEGFSYFSLSPEDSKNWFLKTISRFHQKDSLFKNKSFISQIHDFLSKCADSKIVISFQDLQKWPLHSLKELQLFLNITRRSSSSIIFILEYNTDFTSPSLKAIHETIDASDSYTNCDLKDFSDNESISFIEQATLDSPLPEISKKEIAEKSGGRPLLMVESLRSLKNGTSLSIPKNLDEICQSQVNSLNQNEQHLLGILASSQDHLYWPELKKIWQEEQEVLKKCLSELESKGILKAPSYISQEILFTLPSLKGTYYHLLSSNIIQQAHQKWLDFLLKKWGNQAQLIPASIAIAEHAYLSNHKNIFKEWSWKAAESSIQLRQEEQALEFYQKLEEQSLTKIERIYLFAFKAPLLYKLGKFEEALQAYQQWFDEIKNTSHNETLVQTVKYHLYSGLVFFTWGRPNEAITHLKTCLKTGNPQKHDRLKLYHFRALTLLAALEEKNENYQEAKKYMEQAFSVSIEDALLLAEAEQRLGSIEQASLCYHEALKHYQKSLNYYKKTSNPQAEAIAYHSIALLLKEIGKIQEALTYMQEANNLSQKGGDLLQQGRYLENLALIHLDQGAYSLALNEMEDAQDILKEYGEDLDHYFSKIHSATLYFSIGNFDRTEKIIQDLERNPNTHHNPIYKIPFLFLKAEHVYIQKKYSEAKFNFETILETSKKQNQNLNFLNAKIGIARCLIRLHSSDIQKLSESTLPFISSVSSSHIQVWKEILEYYSEGVHSRLSPETFLKTLEKIKNIEQIELRIELYSILAIVMKRLQLNNLSNRLWESAQSETKNILQLLPEELKMDFEKNRNLKSLDEHLNNLLPNNSPEENKSPIKTRTASNGGIPETKFKRFNEINCQLAKKIDLDEILERVMDAAIEITHAERGFLLLKTPSTTNEKILENFHVTTARHFNQRALKESEFQFSMSAVEEAVKLGTYLLTDNAQYDTRLQDKTSVSQFSLKSILVVPLELEGEILGVIYLDHRYKPECFSEEDVVLLTAFAGQAALAIQKAKMIEELKSAKEKLEEKVDSQAKHIQSLSNELSQARESLRYGYEEIVGQSPSIIKVFQLLDRVTETTIPVWICGESGTGKELIAKSLHYNSSRKDQPFITENVSAIPETLLESELFGHTKGAFTHATHDRMGLFEQANGGTLFLDEISDMSLAMQSKLLRVLQEGEIRPVGSNKKIKIDVRLVTASNQDLQKMVQDKKFRQDLFFRINGLTIKLPPLRERKEDIPMLIDYLVKKISKNFHLKASEVNPEALQFFLQYEWPGNIRELEGTLRNLLLFSNGNPITPELLSINENLFQTKIPTLKQNKETKTSSIEQVSEKKLIEDALKKHKLDKKMVADELGISLKTLYTHMQRHEIPKSKTILLKYLGLKK